MTDTTKLLAGLNEPQKEAVLHTEGPLLIFAGAGSGKTRVITHRVAYLIAKGVAPESILAVTFTNKAAGEMRERIAKLLDDPPEPPLVVMAVHGGSPWIGTFHSLGAYILREDGRAIGIPRSYTILDEDDSIKTIKRVLEQEGVESTYYTPARLKSLISWIKNNEPDQAELDEKLRHLFEAYEKELARSKSLDFDDLLQKTVLLLTNHPAVAERYQHRWRYIHIDEYQDTNHAQYLLTRLLAHAHRNVAVVGDDDQAIYSWRGADWRNILSFQRDWPEARVIALEENYRSSPLILQAANAVIARNAARHPKQLWTRRDGGALLWYLIADNSAEEARAIALHMLTLLEEGEKPEEMAILFRTNAQSRALEEALIAAGIPYRLVSGTKFYERKEIKDLLSYLRYAVNPSDRVALARILNTPPRGIGKTLEVKYFARLAGGQAHIAPLKSFEKMRIDRFEKLMTMLQKIVHEKKAHEALEYIAQETAFETYLAGEKNGEERIENIRELFGAARRYEELPAPDSTQKLLEEAALMSEQDALTDRRSPSVMSVRQSDGGGWVPLMTVHAAKGLEFNVVYVTGLEEGLFPHALSQEPQELEEERRLFYVALTRARKQVILASSEARFSRGELVFSEPSRFLAEIPPHLLEIKAPQDFLPTIQL
ncbi:MAG: UvrD-helicase domain-containing protein [Patescibacteria group bacterium]